MLRSDGVSSKNGANQISGRGKGTIVSQQIAIGTHPTTVEKGAQIR